MLTRKEQKSKINELSSSKDIKRTRTWEEVNNIEQKSMKFLKREIKKIKSSFTKKVYKIDKLLSKIID